MSTPCERSPEDWFIEKDGKQYPDDVLVTQDEIDAALAALGGEVDDLSALVADLEASAVRAALIRRRRARDACHVECPARLDCLAIAIGPMAPRSGTWGGYYPDELNKIRDLRDERQARREAESHDADVAPDE